MAWSVKQEELYGFKTVHPRCVFMCSRNNVTQYSLTHLLFFKYFMNLQLPATCCSFLEPSSGWKGKEKKGEQPEDGSKKLQHVAGSCKFIKHVSKNCFRLCRVMLFTW